MPNSSRTSCIFCKIARGELDAAVVHQDNDHLAFLDHNPLFPGHCLLVPRPHYVTLTDVPPDEIGPLFTCAQRIARAVEAAMSADGFFVAMNNRVSQSVPHLHVHIIPRKKKDGLRGFFWPRVKYAGSEDMERVRDSIARALASIQDTK